MFSLNAETNVTGIDKQKKEMNGCSVPLQLLNLYPPSDEPSALSYLWEFINTVLGLCGCTTCKLKFCDQCFNVRLFMLSNSH